MRKELVNQVRTRSLQARESETGEVLIATKEAIALETSIIKQIKDGKSAVFPLMGKECISMNKSPCLCSKNKALLHSSTDNQSLLFIIWPDCRGFNTCFFLWKTYTQQRLVFNRGYL